MIHSSLFLDQCKKSQFTLFTGTPCSYLKPFINTVIDDPELDFVATTNEGDAVALASGAWLGGRQSVVMFQNSGLGNAVNPLTSLSYILKVPFIGIVTLRGEPKGPKDEPQHLLMGQITTALLDLMKIPWSYFPTEKDLVESAFQLALTKMKDEGLPFFFVMKKDSVCEYELSTSLNQNKRRIRPYQNEIKNGLKGPVEMKRTEVLSILKNNFSPKDIFIATTGKTGRELFEIEDSPNQLYMVGSMGCALAIGLGLSKTNFNQKICVIDGDGALLMRMGNLAIAGQINPSNLVHVLLDNGVHDSTGGQSTFSESVDFSEMARACGYQNIYDVDNCEDLVLALKEINEKKGLSFLRIFIKQGSPKNLGRPTVDPASVALRLKKFIKNNV